MKKAISIFVMALTFLLSACDNSNYKVELSKKPAPTGGPWCDDEKNIKPGQPKPYCGSLPSLAAINVREARLDIISDDLKRPWAFELLDESRLIVTEVSGKIKVIEIESGAQTNIDGLPDVAFGVGQTGLLDIALHPDFAANKTIYFSYVGQRVGGDGYALKLARAVLTGNSLNNVEDIFVATPYTKSTSNFGGAILFALDGNIIFSTGDRTLSKAAQDTMSLHGKIVRITEDGKLPADNPYVDNPDFHPAIYAYGVRNPQGLVQDRKTGVIYETEHGPMGGDEVNIVTAGSNYGWPIVSYGMNYTYVPIGSGTESDGIERPLFYYLPSHAISPIEIYSGEMFPEWEGDLLIGALRTHLVSKLDLNNNTVISESTILNELNNRVRDIKVASDGSIFVVVEKGSLYRLWRDEKLAVLPAAGSRSGKQVYDLVCASCHSNPEIPDAPQLGIKKDWEQRLSGDRQLVYIRAILGFNNMPPKGNCSDCTKKEVGQAVNYMLESID